MTYDEALAFWYGRIGYERRQPRPDDLKLDRMRALLRRLGDPHRRLRCVHVAGTKGKGSTSAIIASILRSAGYRTGLFPSPHLSDVSATFFEVSTALGFLHFDSRRGDVAVLEVGLGGRFDSTNVCEPLVSVVT